MLICDRRISLFGAWFSQDGHAKFTQVHHDWFGMFAGGIEETNLMLKEVNRSLSDLKAVPFEKAVDHCRLAYSKVRKRLVETQILPEFDISTYQQFKRLKRKDEALYLKIQDKISSAEENWNLLFAGFDGLRTPHLFVISGPGNVQYCDSQKYAAIGSGAFAALVWLSFCGYGSRRPLGELLFGAMSAKFFAERAQDVGEMTVVSTVRSDMYGLLHFNQEEIAKVRAAWNALPKFSEDAVKELEAHMQQAHQLLRAAFAARPLSTFQTSAQAK